MDPRFLRNIAQQARKLLPVARTDFAKAQLRVWIAEFDALAQNAEREMATIWPCSPVQIVTRPSEQRQQSAPSGLRRCAGLHHRNATATTALNSRKARGPRTKLVVPSAFEAPAAQKRDEARGGVRRALNRGDLVRSIAK